MTGSDSLLAGDVRRGQHVFNGPKAVCSSRRAIGYLGGKVGPEPRRIGRVRAERDLLEAILVPNVSFVRSHEPVAAATKSGETLNGIPRKDSEEPG